MLFFLIMGVENDFHLLVLHDSYSLVNQLELAGF